MRLMILRAFSCQGCASASCFPGRLAADVEAALQIMPGAVCPPPQPATSDPCASWGSLSTFLVVIYYHEPDEERILTLTGTQKILLSCLYSRHHDGYVRERHLHRLLPSADPWCHLSFFSWSANTWSK